MTPTGDSLCHFCVDYPVLKELRASLVEGLGAGGEGDDRGWDGWVASPTRWAWVWVNSGSWWWTGRPGVLRFMGSQRVGNNWATELNWTGSSAGKDFACNAGDPGSIPGWGRSAGAGIGYPLQYSGASLVAQLVKNLSACNAGDLGSIPGSGRWPRGGNGHSLQYSCLENFMERGAWQATVYGFTESDMTEWLTRIWYSQNDKIILLCLFLEIAKEMATHSSILVWRIPGTEEPGGLSSMGSHRVGPN